MRRRWSVMEPAALLVLVCCQSQPPASSSSSLSKLLPPSWQWMHAAAGLQGPRPACSTSLATRAPQALCKQAARSAPLAAQRRFKKNGLLLKRAMERFSLELEATEVFYGKNQSCRACRVEHACTFALRALRRYYLVLPRVAWLSASLASSEVMIRCVRLGMRPGGSVVTNHD